MMNDQNTTATAATAATAATSSTCHSASSDVAVTVATTNQQQQPQQQQQQNEEEGEKEQGFISRTSPRETDIILLLDDNEEEQQQQQQHHIGNIRYQNFIDNIVSIHHHQYHENNNNEEELVNNIIDTIYRNKGSFITKQQECCRRLGLRYGRWSTVIDRDIIRKKVCHSLLLSRKRRRKRKNNQIATTQTQSVEVEVEVAAAAAAVGVTTTAMTTTMANATSTNSKRRRRNNDNNNNDDHDHDDDKLEELSPSKKGKKNDKSLLPSPPPPTTTTAIFTTTNSKCSSCIAFDASSTTATTNTTVPAQIYDDLNDENIICDIIKDDNNNDDDEYEDEDEQHEHDYKYYEQLSSGCLTFGQSEENYEDIIFRSTSSSRNNNISGGDCSYNWKEQIFEDMKKIYRRYNNHDHAHTAHTYDSISSDGRRNSTNGIRLRILFSSRITTPQDVIDVLQYMIELNFFSNFDIINNNNNKRSGKRSNSINHLAFGLIEVVNDFELDIQPLSIPINIFGKVLKTITSMQRTSSAEGTSDGSGSDGGIPLQSLNIKNIKFIGTRNEFNTTFEQLSKCNTIKEFIFESCRFQEGDDDSIIIRNGTTGTNNSTNTQLFNLMFNALQQITSLEVLSISDIPLDQCSKSFNQILLKEEDLFTTKKQQHRKKKKKLKVLSISECTISDSTLKVVFGSSKTNSRVEKLSLVDVISSKEQRCKLIQYIRDGNDCNGDDGDNHLTTSKNRSRSSLKYLSLNWINDDYLSVSQTIDLMNALEVNNSLKVLHLDVDCTSNLLCDKESSFINSIQKLSGLQVLHLTLSGMSGQKGLECISSIVRNGIGQNSTLKKVDFLVSGYYHRQRTEKQKDDFCDEFSSEINSSLIHALTTTTTTTSSSSCDDLDGDEDICSTSVSRGSAGSCSGFGCVLEDFYLYVDGTFSIDLNDEVQFWLSMNENNLKQKLTSDLNNYKLWIDSIIEHQLDEKIVYYLLRQNPALLLFLLPSNQQNIQPNYDSMITTPTVEEVI
ncbi:hypothetical protein FRACYDRAFT_248119 [Fragilariopsis cylindrus CCMP1102]|uniref:Uncharacterized protein n=1 Tax=Fragilariopsis cylindrus CCMP1102 TaxID=635003 RepID=A0A1E7EV17_9STRA|nr:hypothetical protein FRACYDRAFT_248119 [Fragilariopsis cylindrus CCMP1102]|eukprot:OEU09870.1 hypothetical protein FRACYDRAFT_248119 [Fragilariopsis cylindrus CCMP1102]